MRSRSMKSSGSQFNLGYDGCKREKPEPTIVNKRIFIAFAVEEQVRPRQSGLPVIKGERP